MKVDFAEFNKQTVEQINKQLTELLKEWRREIAAYKSLLPLVDQFIDSCGGGKRIRGVLVVLGRQLAAHLGGVSFDYAQDRQARLEGEEIFKAAAAYEIFHRALLAHDDVIDQSRQRNSKPSLYQALGGDRRGQSLAVCLGDAGFFLAVRTISKSSFPAQVKTQALNWFSQTMLDTTLGQVLDINKADPITTAELKTARYSISGPLILGVILGGVKSRLSHLQGVISSLGEFGENLGIAFQIKDDILDSEADSWGGVDCAKKEAEKYQQQALKILPGITKDEKMSKILKQLAEYLVERTK